MVLTIGYQNQIGIALVCPLGTDKHSCSDLDLYDLLGIQR